MGDSHTINWVVHVFLARSLMVTLGCVRGHVVGELDRQATVFTAIGLTFVWLGVVLALSFLEAPLKFRAPGITRELGLGIGRLVFRSLNVIELVLAVAIAVFAVADDGATALPWLYYALIAILGAQTLMLHLHMDKRAARIVQGEVLSPSNIHYVYIGLEVIKVAGLIALGVHFLQEVAG